MYNFSELKEKVSQIEVWLTKELANIRTGRATPIILDSIFVDAYGSKMSLKEVANIILEDVRSIRVEPWDASLTKAIEKSIVTSNLGLSAVPFEKGVRIIFPELTSERREQLAKVVKQKLEEARVSLRALREKIWNEIQEKEKEGGMGEDDKFRFKEELQNTIDQSGKKLEEMSLKKELEIKN